MDGEWDIYVPMSSLMSEQKDIYVCSRLKEERLRLKLGQDVVADTCVVTRKTVGRWESNIPIPSDKLGLLRSLGFDSCYVVTGSKSAIERAFDKNAAILELVEDCAAALRIIERDHGLKLSDDKFGKIVAMLFEEYYDAAVSEHQQDKEPVPVIDTAKVIQLARLAS
jgi:transcriptional regulator with XRE-family HTH domain